MTYSIKHKIVLLKKQYYGEKRKRGGHMVFNTGAALLDAIVLAVVSKVTEKGMVQLNLYRAEWKSYSTKISELFEGGIQA